MNPETYPWTQADEEDYDSNASPEEQAEALASRERYTAQLIAGMRAAVATVPSYCERPQAEETYDQLVCEARQMDDAEETAAWLAENAARAELAAFEQSYLEEHGVYPALCDLPEHLIYVATH